MEKRDQSHRSRGDALRKEKTVLVRHYSHGDAKEMEVADALNISSRMTFSSLDLT